MTPEERKMLEDLANRIGQTPPPQRDAEAEEFIRTRIGSRPDALYLLTQTVLIQNMAIAHAQQQIQELQQRSAAPQPVQQSGSFLGGAGQGYTAPPPPPPPQQAAPPSGWGQGGGSSFLHSAATTAAGIAAGALAFEGIRSLFGHSGGWFGGGPMQSGFLGGGSGLFGGAPGGETIINNYYDSPEDRGDDNSSDQDDSGSDQDADDSGQGGDDADYSGGDFGDGSSSGGDDFV